MCGHDAPRMHMQHRGGRALSRIPRRGLRSGAAAPRIGGAQRGICIPCYGYSQPTKSLQVHPLIVFRPDTFWVGHRCFGWPDTTGHTSATGVSLGAKKNFRIEDDESPRPPAHPFPFGLSQIGQSAQLNRRREFRPHSHDRCSRPSRLMMARAMPSADSPPPAAERGARQS